MSYCEVFKPYSAESCAKYLRLLGKPETSIVCDDAARGAVVKVCQPGGVISMQAAQWKNPDDSGDPTLYGPVLYPAASTWAIAAAGVVGIGLATYLLFGR